MLESLNYKIIFIVLVVIIILVIVIVLITNKKKHIEEYKLVKFSGLFPSISNLNIGHPSNAPIFHARPWLGSEMNKGLTNYLGLVNVPDGKSLYIQFPKEAKNYEVNTISYPSWELIGETIYEPKIYELNNIKDNVLILITGIGDDNWLNKSRVYFSDISNKIYPEKSPPVVDESKYIKDINTFYNSTIGENTYLIDQMTSDLDDSSFPNSSGIIMSLTYTPRSLDENIYLIYPNRVYTSGIESAIYVEINKKKVYLKQEDSNISSGIYSYKPETLDPIYIEERYMVSHSSKVLPFYLYIV